MIIGVSGKMASGKDTLVSYLMSQTGGVRIAFADKLKDVVADLFGVDARSKDPAVRRLLQEVGVKMREVEPDVWVNYAMRKAERALAGTGEYAVAHPVVLISDVRFPNELWRIWNTGGTVVRTWVDESTRIERIKRLYPGTEKDPARMNHVSETALDDFDADALINTLTPMKMKQDAASILQHLRLAGIIEPAA